MHITCNNAAFRNKSAGFYANHHPVANIFYITTAMYNRWGYNILGVDKTGSGVNLGVLRNNVSSVGRW